ncbi:MAG: P-loop NTPase fold protein [Candidatus Gracilibacteria bacterium]|nr:P-loop NTPase fold protein [Candidatus Gracilibacteria bacterium]
MYTTGFIKNPELIEENSRSENLLDLTSEIERFSAKLDSIKFSSLFGFIGKFGTGKTTFLNQIKDKYTENSKWFEFDAWKYPDRKDLWEAFILEIVKQSYTKKDGKKIKKQIEGKSTKSVWLDIITDITSSISENFDFNFLDKFSEIFKKEPITKIYEFQKILIEIFDKLKEENIYMIIEDIDRSGDNGIFFLETLNHFLKTNEIEKRIIVVVPIGEENYKKEEVKLSYLKSLDYIHEYSLREVKLDNFVKELFLDEIYSVNHLKGQVITFLEGIFKEFTDQITMRTLKHILRNANSNYIALLKKQGEGVDWRLSIVFETAKYIKHNSGDFYIDIWRKTKKVGGSESIFSALIDSVFRENHRVDRGQRFTDIYEEDYSGDKKVIKTRVFSYNVPIKFVSYKYISGKAKDGVLYFTDDFNRKNNYVGIIDDFLD